MGDLVDGLSLDEKKVQAAEYLKMYSRKTSDLSESEEYFENIVKGQGLNDLGHALRKRIIFVIEV